MVCAVPPNVIVDASVKPDPFTVNINGPVVPCAAVVGLILVVLGTTYDVLTVVFAVLLLLAGLGSEVALPTVAVVEIFVIVSTAVKKKCPVADAPEFRVCAEQWIIPVNPP